MEKAGGEVRGACTATTDHPPHIKTSELAVRALPEIHDSPGSWRPVPVACANVPEYPPPLLVLVLVLMRMLIRRRILLPYARHVAACC